MSTATIVIILAAVAVVAALVVGGGSPRVIQISRRIVRKNKEGDER